MRKNYAKKALLLLIVCLSVLAIIGCKAKTAPAQTSGGAVKQSINFTGYPIDAKDKVITWFGSECYQPNQVYASADQSPFHIYLQEMLGVKIEWQWPIRGTDPV